MNDEDLHKKLYEAHRLLVAGADQLHQAIVILTANSRHRENREKFKQALADLAEARDKADEAWTKAGNARSDIIKTTGCDGTCA